MKAIDAISPVQVCPPVVYHMTQFGVDPDPDPDVRAEKHVENPPSLKIIPDLSFVPNVVIFGLRPLQTSLINITSGGCCTMSESKDRILSKFCPSRSGQTFNIAPYGKAHLQFSKNSTRVKYQFTFLKPGRIVYNNGLYQQGKFRPDPIQNKDVATGWNLPILTWDITFKGVLSIFHQCHMGIITSSHNGPSRDTIW